MNKILLIGILLIAMIIFVSGCGKTIPDLTQSETEIEEEVSVLTKEDFTFISEEWLSKHYCNDCLLMGKHCVDSLMVRYKLSENALKLYYYIHYTPYYADDHNWWQGDRNELMSSMAGDADNIKTAIIPLAIDEDYNLDICFFLMEDGIKSNNEVCFNKEINAICKR